MGATMAMVQDPGDMWILKFDAAGSLIWVRHLHVRMGEHRTLRFVKQ